jgi:hypothetical protein
MSKKGVTKDIIERLKKEGKKFDIENKVEKPYYDVSVIVEPHQAKIQIPKDVRLEMGIEKTTKCKLYYDIKKKEIICKFK